MPGPGSGWLGPKLGSASECLERQLGAAPLQSEIPLHSLPPDAIIYVAGHNRTLALLISGGPCLVLGGVLHIVCFRPRVSGRGN
jgi:hypothetical protein